MRTAGIDEEYITGNKSFKEKFLKYCSALEFAAGNPLYHWSHMELSMFFGIDLPITASNAEVIWEKANEYIKKTEMSPRKLIEQSNVEIICTTDDIIDDLSWHKKIAEDKTFNTKVLPSFRTDNLLLIKREGYTDYIKKLSEVSGTEIADFKTLKSAVSNRLDFFCLNGCRCTDLGIPLFPNRIAGEADSSIDGQIKAMIRNNLNGLEIRGVDGQNVSDISVEKAKEVKTKLDDAGLITWSIGSPIGKININDDFSAHKDKFKHTSEIAKILNSDNMRIFSFYMPENEKAEKYRNQVIEYLSEMCEIAKPYNINLCHENEKGIYGDIEDRCLEIFKAVPELKGIFDPANFVQCDVDTLKAWELLKEHIYYMHIKDSLSNGMVVPAGEGDGNVTEIVRQYINRGGKYFTIEPHLKVFDGLKKLERENEQSIILKYSFEDNNTAFDTVCKAFKSILEV